MDEQRDARTMKAGAASAPAAEGSDVYPERRPETAPGPVARRAAGARAVTAKSAGALALGAVAIGAVAVGALAVGRLAIARLSVGRSRVRRLQIDELEVTRLLVHEIRGPIHGAGIGLLDGSVAATRSEAP